jgi:hypothetical protein
MARKKSAGNAQYGLMAVETVKRVTRSDVGHDDVKIPGRADSAMGVDSVTFHGAGTGRPKVCQG